MQTKPSTYFICSVFLLLLSLSSSASCGDSNALRYLSPPRSTASDTVTIYITGTGKKYHVSNCCYLNYSKASISLQEAKRLGYVPCKVCAPPK